MNKPSQVVRAVAKAWASMDGKSVLFCECENDSELDGKIGVFEGYCADAEEIIKRIEDRGFVIVRKP